MTAPKRARSYDVDKIVCARVAWHLGSCSACTNRPAAKTAEKAFGPVGKVLDSCLVYLIRYSPYFEPHQPQSFINNFNFSLNLINRSSLLFLHQLCSLLSHEPTLCNETTHFSSLAHLEAHSFLAMSSPPMAASHLCSVDGILLGGHLHPCLLSRPATLLAICFPCDPFHEFVIFSVQRLLQARNCSHAENHQTRWARLAMAHMSALCYQKSSRPSCDLFIQTERSCTALLS